MNEPQRPLPRADEFDTREFWAGTKEKVFKYQQCNNCGAIMFYPRAVCTGCTDSDLDWKEASGRATLYTYSVVRQSYHPFFRNLVPYVVAWVDLEEGPRILTNVVGVEDVSQVEIGMALELTWEEHEDLNIPLFQPAS